MSKPIYSTSIDVGKLRASIAAFGARMIEGVDPQISVDNVLGIDGQAPSTDFADAFRAVMANAAIRLSRDEAGQFVVHDLLLKS